MKDFFKSDLFLQVACVLGGQLARTGLGFLSIIMVARLLTVADFGLFSIFMATIAVGVEITGKSLDWALVRFASEHIDKAKDKAYQYFISVFKMRIVVATLFLILGLLLAEFIANEIFQHPEYKDPIFYACMCTIWMSLWWFSLAVIQTKEKFLLHGIINVSNGLVKLGAVGVLFYFNIKELEPMLQAHVVVFF